MLVPYMYYLLCGLVTHGVGVAITKVKYCKAFHIALASSNLFQRTIVSGCWVKPYIMLDKKFESGQRVTIRHATLEPFILEAETLSQYKDVAKVYHLSVFLDESLDVLKQYSLQPDILNYVQGEPKWLFTENNTNLKRLYGSENITPYVKDAFHEYVINGNHNAVNPAMQGSFPLRIRAMYS